ncbi:MAG: hypothetical protein GY854_00740 [Deltaproteobacteria bacterium]|nr:hypothetical protein [Deltaproteobacteria bacterium]
MTTSACGSAVPELNPTEVLESIPVLSSQPTKLSDKTQQLLLLSILNTAQTPVQNAMYWTTNDAGDQISYWLRGNALQVGFVATRADLVIPWRNALWFLEETETPLTLCDCTAWKINNFEGECPETDGDAFGIAIHLVDRISGEEVQLLSSAETSNAPFRFSEYHAEATPIASVGPYLFMQYKEKGEGCRDNRQYQSSEFLVFSLETMEVVDILSSAEEEQIAEKEQIVAFEQIQADELAAVRHASDLGLVAIEPRYSQSAALSVTYRFATDAVHDSDEGTWHADFTGSVLVPAVGVPISLQPFIIPPAVVSVFASGIPGTRQSGWSIIAGSPEEISGLWNAFSTQ